MSEKILVVDDEERVLSGIKRSLHGKFSIVTALGAEAALQELRQDPNFAVVMSDMRMPNIDGAQFLQTVRAEFPALVRLMLTGNNDQETAKKAVNDGAVYRFLNKPCSADELSEALSSALERYRAEQIEHDVLDRTLSASIDVLADILSVACPASFGASTKIADLCSTLAAKTGGIEDWAIRTAASISTIGHIAVDDELIAKRRSGTDLSRNELLDYMAHAEVGADLVAKIPRMDAIAEIIRYQERGFDGTGLPTGGPTGEEIPVGARILSLVNAFELLRSNGWSSIATCDRLKSQSKRYDPTLLAALDAHFADEDSSLVAQRVPVGKLNRTMTIHEDVNTVDGVLIVCKGQAVTLAVAKHLQKLTERGALTIDPLIVAPAT